MLQCNLESTMFKHVTCIPHRTQLTTCTGNKSFHNKNCQNHSTVLSFNLRSNQTMLSTVEKTVAMKSVTQW